jgi:hypothetical protein
VIEEGTGAKRSWYISGRAIVAGEVNANGRIYNPDVVAREVARYDREMIQPGKALGEMTHPQSPNINYDRVSHIVKELRREGNTWIMKAKLLDTPCGKIAQSLVAEGVPLGVSTRALGSVARDARTGAMMVGADLKLSCIDIVSQPSGPGCWTEGLYEDAPEWVLNEATGEWVQTRRRQSNWNLATEQIECFERFLESLRS